MLQEFLTQVRKSTQRQNKIYQIPAHTKDNQTFTLKNKTSNWRFYFLEYHSEKLFSLTYTGISIDKCLVLAICCYNLCITCNRFIEPSKRIDLLNLSEGFAIFSDYEICSISNAQKIVCCSIRRKI